MAKAIATTEAAGETKGPSLVIQIAVLLALTGVAAGAGLFAGNHLTGSSAGSGKAAPASAHGDGKHAGDPVADEEKRGIVTLAPITTNLAAPDDVWVRMELAAVFEGAPDPAVADAVHQDLIAFLRTVKLHQIEGASGYQHLKADMEERAAIRSEGKVKALLVRTLLFE